MNQTSEQCTLIDEGVAFTIVTVDFTKHDCIISREALDFLSRQRGVDFEPLEIFQAFEAKIRGVARRLIAARVKEMPLRIEPRSFH